MQNVDFLMSETIDNVENHQLFAMSISFTSVIFCRDNTLIYLFRYI
jgi:hypothetical protein